jgi:hypothetical protein
MSAVGFLAALAVTFVCGWFCGSYFDEEARRDDR